MDTVVFKSPSLRDVVNQEGEVNGRLMHTANFVNLRNVLNHYNRINLFPQVPGIADAIDERLLPNGNPQNLNITNQERNAVIAFLGTLTGSDVYTNEKWSNPFDENAHLEILNSPLTTSTATIEKIEFNIYPNPVLQELNIQGDIDKKIIEVYHLDGHLLQSIQARNDQISIPFYEYTAGTYLSILTDGNGKKRTSQKIIKI